MRDVRKGVQPVARTSTLRYYREDYTSKKILALAALIACVAVVIGRINATAKSPCRIYQESRHCQVAIATPTTAVGARRNSTMILMRALAG